MPCPYCTPSKSLHHEIDDTPCTRCLGHMKDGILVIAAHKDGTRAGGFIVVKEQTMLDAITDDELRKNVKAERAVLMDPETWKSLGLPNLRNL